MSAYDGRTYVAEVTRQAVGDSPPWSFDRDPPLEIGAAIEAARNALEKIPGATEKLSLDEIYVERSDQSHRFYCVIFSAPDPENHDRVTVPVLFSGKAVEPKQERDRRREAVDSASRRK